MNQTIQLQDKSQLYKPVSQYYFFIMLCLLL